MKNVVVLITIAILLSSPFALAGKIYKWTDSEGNVHYGAQPPSKNAQQIKVPVAPASSSTAATKPGNQVEATQKLLDAFAKDRQDKDDAAQKLLAKQEIARKNCSQARKQVASLNQGGRKYEMTEEGERKYLDQTDIQQRLKKAQETRAKWCV